MNKHFDIININCTSIFEKELINNELLLKKGHILRKSKKRSYLIDTFNDYIYIHNENSNFKDLCFTPVQLQNLKSKNFAKLKVLSNLIEYKNPLKEIPRVDNILKKEKKNFLFTSNYSSLNTKYKFLLSKASNLSCINSFLLNNNKKDIFLTSYNYFFIKRGSFNYLQNNCFLDINFKNIKNNFVISKKRKTTSLTLNSYFSFKKIKNEKDRKNSKTNNN